MKDTLYLVTLASLLLLSGEQEQTLRRRLESEQNFSEALATEAHFRLEKLYEKQPTALETGNQHQSPPVASHPFTI